MLNALFSNQFALGAAQAVVAIILALLVMMVARWSEIHLEKEITVSLGRGLVQIVIVGSVLMLLLNGPGWTSAIVLSGMVLAAAAIAARRAGGIRDAFWVSLYGIGFGAGVVIVSMTFLGVIDKAITSLIPVGSMLIANCMNTSAVSPGSFQGRSGSPCRAS